MIKLIYSLIDKIVQQQSHNQLVCTILVNFQHLNYIMLKSKYLCQSEQSQFITTTQLLDIYLNQKIINQQLYAWGKIKLSARVLNGYLHRNAQNKHISRSNIIANKTERIPIKRRVSTLEDTHQDHSIVTHNNGNNDVKQLAEKAQIKLEDSQISYSNSTKEYEYTKQQTDENFQDIILSRLQNLQKKFQHIKIISGVSQKQNLSYNNTSFHERTLEKQTSTTQFQYQPKYISMNKTCRNNLIKEEQQFQIDDIDKQKTIPKLNLPLNRQDTLPLQHDKQYWEEIPTYKQHDKNHQQKQLYKADNKELISSRKSRNHSKMISRQKQNYPKNRQLFYKRTSRRYNSNLSSCSLSNKDYKENISSNVTRSQHSKFQQYSRNPIQQGQEYGEHAWYQSQKKYQQPIYPCYFQLVPVPLCMNQPSHYIKKNNKNHIQCSRCSNRQN